MKTKPLSARRPLLIVATICLPLLAILAGASAMAESASLTGSSGLTEGSGDYAVYLPYTMKFGLPSSQGTLDNDGVFIGVDGVGIGALSNTLTETIGVGIGRSLAPTLTLPSTVDTLGHYYTISATEDIFVSPDSPLIVALPVPAGAMTSSLALASFSSSEDVTDVDANMQAWSFLEGMYDPDDNLFLTTIAGLTSEGRTFTLVEHPYLESPPNNAAPRGSASTRPGAALVQFNVICSGYDLAPSLCTDAERSAVAAALSDIHDGIQGDHGFDPPRLRNLAGDLDFNPNLLASLGYSAYIEPKATGYCDKAGAGGYVDPEDGRLVFCLRFSGLGNKFTKTLAHEMFHATEFAYGPTLNDYNTGNAELWIIEGMAHAAVESYSVNEMHRTEYGTWEELHVVDKSIRIGQPSDDELDEYFAQDFWVHNGQWYNNALSYLELILDKGATSQDVVDVLGDGQRLEAYWWWAKNQVLEKAIDFDGALQNPCNLESQVVETLNIFPHHWEDYPSHRVLVGPLTTAVVEIQWSHGYDLAFGWVVPTAQGNVDAEMALKYKFYVDGEDGCEFVEDGHRFFEEDDGGIDLNKTYYVLISNIDRDDTYEYEIRFELAPIPPTWP